MLVQAERQRFSRGAELLRKVVSAKEKPHQEVGP